MSTVDILSPAGEKTGSVELPAEIFGVASRTIGSIADTAGGSLFRSVRLCADVLLAGGQQAKRSQCDQDHANLLTDLTGKSVSCLTVAAVYDRRQSLVSTSRAVIDRPYS